MIAAEHFENSEEQQGNWKALESCAAGELETRELGRSLGAGELERCEHGKLGCVAVGELWVAGS